MYIIIVVIGSFLLSVVPNRFDKAKLKTFDEKQRLAKLKAFKVSAYSMIFALLLLSMIELAIERTLFDKGFFSLAVIAVGVTSQKVYEILNNAYFSLNDRKKGFIHNLFVGIAMYLIFPIYILLKPDTSLMEHGVIMLDASAVVMIASILIIMLVFLLKHFVDKRNTHS